MHGDRGDMHARFAIAMLAALVLVNDNALTSRDDRNLEAANPIRPLHDGSLATLRDVATTAGGRE